MLLIFVLTFDGFYCGYFSILKSCNKFLCYIALDIDSWLSGLMFVLVPSVHVLLIKLDSYGNNYFLFFCLSLAAIARKRPFHYNTILSALLEFEPNFEMVKSRHAASIQYSFRSAFLGFLRCMNPVILEVITESCFSFQHPSGVKFIFHTTV